MRVGAGLLVDIMLVVTVRNTTALAYQTGRDAREALLYRPTSLQVRELTALVDRLVSHQAFDPREVDIAYESDLDLWLGWYLRDYTSAQSGVLKTARPALLMTRPRSAEEQPVGYLGQRFHLVEESSQAPSSLAEAWKWFVYRYPQGEVETSDVEVWTWRPETQPQE